MPHGTGTHLIMIHPQQFPPCPKDPIRPMSNGSTGIHLEPKFNIASILRPVVLAQPYQGPPPTRAGNLHHLFAPNSDFRLSHALDPQSKQWDAIKGGNRPEGQHEQLCDELPTGPFTVWVTARQKRG